MIVAVDEFVEVDEATLQEVYGVVRDHGEVDITDIAAITLILDLGKIVRALEELAKNEWVKTKVPGADTRNAQTHWVETGFLDWLRKLFSS